MLGRLFPAPGKILVEKPTTPGELAAIQYDLDDWQGADDAMNQLIAAGCELVTLQTLLVRLRRASPTEGWAKAELNRAAKLFDRGATTLGRLKNWGEARNLDLSEDSEQWLSERADDLRRLAERLRERAPKADKRDNRRLGRARARLIDYASQKTGQPYVPLALLISVATGKPHEPDAIRKWWALNAKKYANVLVRD
jgi:hypothetical protein